MSSTQTPTWPLPSQSLLHGDASVLQLPLSLVHLLQTTLDLLSCSQPLLFCLLLMAGCHSLKLARRSVIKAILGSERSHTDVSTRFSPPHIKCTGPFLISRMMCACVCAWDVCVYVSVSVCVYVYVYVLGWVCVCMGVWVRVRERERERRERQRDTHTRT